MKFIKKVLILISKRKRPVSPFAEAVSEAFKEFFIEMGYSEETRNSH